MAAMEEIDRLERFILREPNSGCWLWLGAVNRTGYGAFTRSKENFGKTRAAHRVSYELLVGEIPEGLILDHLCRVRCCVNPRHLEPVTYKENSQRGLTGINKSSVTHCPKGHPYSGDNLYMTQTGKRDCRACRKQAKQRYKERNND